MTTASKQEVIELPLYDFVINEEKELSVKSPEELLISQWKTKQIKSINIPEFNTAKDLINVTLQNFSHATLIEGEGGVGKTFLTIETVKENIKPDNWVYKSGFTSPLAFYKFLYRNRNSEIIILDDVEGIFNNLTSLAILKRATYETAGKRLIFYDTTSHKADNVPPVFEFKARLILLCNRIPNKHLPDTAAFLSRVIHYAVYFTYEQKLEILNQILMGRGDLDGENKKLVFEIIKAETSFATQNLNIRTLEKLISFVKYDSEKAKHLFNETISVNEEEEAIGELLKTSMTTDEQINIFFKLTGKSRSTFYRIKKRVLQKISIDAKNAKVPRKTNDTNLGDEK